jgi:hypothetical protein
VTGIGDINKDGYQDIMVGAPYAGASGKSQAGLITVLFGSPTRATTTIDTASAISPKGISITGAVANNNWGWSVSGAGDFNKDGIDDLIVGAPNYSPPSRTNTGAAVVIFGKTSGWADIGLASFTSGSAGFWIWGAAEGDRCGSSVSTARDINGDGVDDVVVGAMFASPLSRSAAGITYVIFGHSSATAFNTVDLANFMSGGSGYRILGAAMEDQSGYSVSDAGDTNNDGYGDVVIGAIGYDVSGRPAAGAAYVIFGHSAAAAFTDIDLADPPASQVFRISGAMTGDNLGRAVSSAGDFNNDGYDDIVIAAPMATPPSLSPSQAGRVYVLFGSGAQQFNRDLATFTSGSTVGFQVFGAVANGLLGCSVSGARDINADGVDDIIVGSLYGNIPGAAFVLYGGTALSFADIDLSVGLPALRGFRVLGATSASSVGQAVGVADFDGDGVGDVVIGAPNANPPGRGAAGTAYVIYGEPHLPTSQPSRQPSAHPSRQPTGQPTRQPTRQPTSQPSSQPSRQPTRQPSLKPSGQPSAQPASSPTQHPTAQPSSQPTTVPTAQVTATPTGQPTRQPSRQPTSRPSAQPAARPSATPTLQPSGQPSLQPVSAPTGQPSKQPTRQPSRQPIAQPSSQPSRQPSTQPSSHPTTQPSARPTGQPSMQPSRQPTGQPSVAPSLQPSSQPSVQPSRQPTARPSWQPTTQPSVQPSSQPVAVPSSRPTAQPTRQPTRQPQATPTSQPSTQPSARPSSRPTAQPSSDPTTQPSGRPTRRPSAQPTSRPSAGPTSRPTSAPSFQPSSRPSSAPSSQPSSVPTSQPTAKPTAEPSSVPTVQPTAAPTEDPTSQPSAAPSAVPSAQPTAKPSALPTAAPTAQPTSAPTSEPTAQPTSHPSAQPTAEPTSEPSASPTNRPTARPTALPSAVPTARPTSVPTVRPTSAPSVQPTGRPSSQPTTQPSVRPSPHPTPSPTPVPTLVPTPAPTCHPTVKPTAHPSQMPSPAPTAIPTPAPTASPTVAPTAIPTASPSRAPTCAPTRRPSAAPTVMPTEAPSQLPTVAAGKTAAPSRAPTTAPTLSEEQVWLAQQQALFVAAVRNQTVRSVVHRSAYRELQVRSSSPTTVVGSCNAWRSMLESDLDASALAYQPVQLQLIAMETLGFTVTVRCDDAVMVPSLVQALLNKTAIYPLTLSCGASAWTVARCSSLRVPSMCVNCSDPCAATPHCSTGTATTSPFTVSPCVQSSCPSGSSVVTAARYLDVSFAERQPAPSVLSRSVFSTKTSLEVSATLNAPGSMYCAAYVLDPNAESPPAPSSTSSVLLQNFVDSTDASNVTVVTISGLPSATDFLVYCMTVSRSGSMQSLEDVLAQPLAPSTTCCIPVLVQPITTTVTEGTALRNFLQISVNTRPMADITITLDVTSTSGSSLIAVPLFPATFRIGALADSSATFGMSGSRAGACPHCRANCCAQLPR